MLNKYKNKYHLLIVLIIIIVYLFAGLYFVFVETETYDTNRGFPVIKGGDSNHYALLAENLIEHKSFTSSTEAPFTPEMFRSPGYSFFLVPFKAISNSFVPVVFAQILLIIISSLLIYNMGKALISTKAGLVASLLFALNPATIFYTFTILSDILFVSLFVTAIYFLFFKQTLRLPQIYLFVFIGSLALGYAILVRPAGLYSIAIIFPFLLYYFIKRLGIKNALIVTLFFLVTCVSILAPWHIRNHEYSDSYTLSSIGPYTLLFYDVAGYLAKKENVGTDEMKLILKDKHFPNIETLVIQSGLYIKETNKISVDYVKADPIGYFLFHSLGSINYFIASSLKDVSNESHVFREFLTSASLLNEQNVSIKAYLKTNGILKGSFALLKSEPLFMVERMAWLFIAILAFIAPILYWRTPEKRFLLLLFLFLVGYFALIFGPVSYPRYRIASEPFLMILAMGSVWFLYQKYIKNSKETKEVPILPV